MLALLLIKLLIKLSILVFILYYLREYRHLLFRRRAAATNSIV